LKFIRHKDGLKVVDLDSSSGTFINSKRLKPREVVEIREGDNIAISPKVVYQLKTNER
jgi:pSer/pThr/pTyr-binding forkhead associated (FHA) protein